MGWAVINLDLHRASSYQSHDYGLDTPYDYACFVVWWLWDTFVALVA